MTNKYKHNENNAKEDYSESKSTDLNAMTIRALEIMYRNWLKTNEPKYPWRDLMDKLGLSDDEFTRMSSYWVDKMYMEWYSNVYIAITYFGRKFFEEYCINNQLDVACEAHKEVGYRKEILNFLKQQWEKSDDGLVDYHSLYSELKIDENIVIRNFEILEESDLVKSEVGGLVAITTSGIDYLEDLELC